MHENQEITIKTKVLIIGGGPAGLSVGYSYSKFETDFIIVDMGKDISHRDRQDEFDCVAGIGGAGLFSDGKFSFFPSGTNVWKLKNRELLEKAYGDLSKLFKDAINFDVPTFPTEQDINDSLGSSMFELKTYPSYYISLEDRKLLLEELVKDFKDKIYLGWKVLDWTKTGGIYVVEAETHGVKKIIECEKIVLAGGRFHPLLLKKVPMTFKRYEFGVRFVGDNSQFAKIQKEDVIDPKWMYRPTKSSEFRTFCMCKDGEYVQSNFLGYKSYSGRADVPPTGFTNFGLTLRLKEFSDVEFQKILGCEPFTLDLNELIQNPELLEKKYGKELAELYMEGLNKFITDFDLSIEGMKVIGPSIEGVGCYPTIDSSLKVDNEEIYAIGDCSGIFRGIIPSMISGNYVGILLNSE